MKKGKKIVIGVAAVAVVAGGFYAVSGGSRGEAQLPQVSVTKAETGDVEEIVDATGTVVSDEQKTFYSPVNAQIKKVSFAEGDSVSKGTKLVEFELKDLERDNQKAELNVKSGEYDYKNPIKIAAPAAAGRIPARIMTGMNVAPTAAAQPAAEGIAMLTKKVTAVAAGISRMPNFLSGAASRLTK